MRLCMGVCPDGWDSPAQVSPCIRCTDLRVKWLLLVGLRPFMAFRLKNRNVLLVYNQPYLARHCEQAPEARIRPPLPCDSPREGHYSRSWRRNAVFLIKYRVVVVVVVFNWIKVNHALVVFWRTSPLQRRPAGGGWRRERNSTRFQEMDW